MNIAICFSGGFRTFPNCYKSIIDKFKQLGNVDCFISTWELPCYSKVDRFNDIHAVFGQVEEGNGLLDASQIITEDYLLDLYPFKIIDIQPMQVMQCLIDQVSHLQWSIMSPSRLLCQYYKIKRCNDICVEYSYENNIRYDIIVKCRCDISISDIPDEIDVEKIYVHHATHLNKKSHIDDMINEMLCISNPYNMSKICNIWDNMSELWNIEDGFGERLSYKNLVKENLLDKTTTFDFGIVVDRGDGRFEPMSLN